MKSFDINNVDAEEDSESDHAWPDFPFYDAFPIIPDIFLPQIHS